MVGRIPPGRRVVDRAHPSTPTPTPPTFKPIRDFGRWINISYLRYEAYKNNYRNNYRLIEIIEIPARKSYRYACLLTPHID